MPNDIVSASFPNFKKFVRAGYLITSTVEQIGVVATWLYIRFHVARIVLVPYIRDLKKRDLTTEEHQAYLNQDRLYDPRDPVYEKGWHVVIEYLDRMATLSAKHSAKLVVVHIPQRRPRTSTIKIIPEHLAKWAADKDVEFVDTLHAILLEEQNTSLYWRRGGHCNAAGYRVIAETVKDALLETGLLDSR